MKKLRLNLENIRLMLSKEEMKKISGGKDTCFDTYECPTGCYEKKSDGSLLCSNCCIA